MRFGVVDQRASIILGDELIDVGEARGGLFASDAAQVLPVWPAFAAWAAADAAGAPRRPLRAGAEFGAPSPRPSQVFVIGANYADHAEESGLGVPDTPMVITKFPSCITGSTAPLAVAHPQVDWEVELVVVLGANCAEVRAGDLIFTGTPSGVGFGRAPVYLGDGDVLVSTIEGIGDLTTRVVSDSIAGTTL
jgi:2,4-didehydro-3-deoxy-L-rhamnonate hydrolase